MQTHLASGDPIDWDSYIEGHLAAIFLRGDLNKAWGIDIFPKLPCKDYTEIERFSWIAGWNSNLEPLLSAIKEDLESRMV